MSTSSRGIDSRRHSVEMSWTAIDYVYRNAADLDATAKAVLLAVAYHANRNGRAWPSIATLACETGLTRRTVQRALGRLTESGHLEVVHRLGKSVTLKLQGGVTVTRGGVTDDQKGCHSDTRTLKNQVEPRSDDDAAVSQHVDAAESKHPALDPATIRACPHCDEFGWLWRDGAIRGRCTHRRAVTDLTVGDVLADGGVAVDD